jgi:hypothetical protein
MRTKTFSFEPLLTVFKKKKIATIIELKEALGCNCSMTVFRKLREMEYITSCSHSGKFYSLKRIARFDDLGLWSFNSVLFSYYETLGQTLRALIEKSNNGYTAAELEEILGVKPNGPLVELIGKKEIKRERISGIYVYFSKDIAIKKQQEIVRKGDTERLRSTGVAGDAVLDEVKASIILFYSMLDEKQRRLYAGLESLKAGHGGDRRIAELLFLNEKTVAKGRKELMDGKIPIDSIRRFGGGRKTIQKKFQTL